MIVLVIGLVLFIGIHSFRIFADPTRERLIARHGENLWRGVYSLFSLLGLALIVWGYGLARSQPVILWSPPSGMQHLALVLTWVAFILLPAAHIPFNHFKQWFGQPMYLGIKVWAFAHLLANGRVEDLLLFGTILVWAIVGYASARRRDRRMGVTYPSGEIKNTLVCVVSGTALWALFVFGLHGWLIGVSPI